MNEETFNQIKYDLNVIMKNPFIPTLRDKIAHQVTYLFALSRFGIITNEEFSKISDKVVKTYMENKDNE